MKTEKASRRYARRRSERGMILLIVVFCLLLLMTLGILMILSAGTETSLNSNYRSSTQAFYSALNGVEEGRGRLWPKHPNALGAFLTAPGTTMAVGEVRYILNPPPGVTVDPTDLSSGNVYADTEYAGEFGTPVSSANVQTISSAAASPGVLAPMYQWVRVNPVTEQSLNVDVNGGGLDGTIPLFYDGHSLNLTSTGNQAFEVTSLAVLPDKSQRMVQCVVAPTPLNLVFPSALTLAGPVASFSGPTSSTFHVTGIDRVHSGPCTTTQTGRSAIGIDEYPSYSDIDDDPNYQVVNTGVQPGFGNNYPGWNVATLQFWRNFVKVPRTAPLDTIGNLDGSSGLVHTIQQNADYNLPGPVTSLPSYGTPSQPVVAAVDGDLSLSSVSGFGLLLVTGNLTIDSSVSWRGIILVIGQGSMTITGSGGGGVIDGAVFLAATRWPDNSLRSSLGPVNFDASSANSVGIYYNSCWINAAQQSGTTYKPLSFRQIQQ